MTQRNTTWDHNNGMTRNQDGPRPKWDPDTCPSGWDPAVWNLALFFQQVGEGYGFETAPRSVVYSLLERRMKKSGLFKEAATVEWIIQYFWDEVVDLGNPRGALDALVGVETWTYCLEMYQRHQKTIALRSAKWVTANTPPDRSDGPRKGRPRQNDLRNIRWDHV